MQFWTACSLAAPFRSFAFFWHAAICARADIRLVCCNDCGVACTGAFEGGFVPATAIADTRSAAITRVYFVMFAILVNARIAGQVSKDGLNSSLAVEALASV